MDQHHSALLGDTLLGNKAGQPDGYGYVARTDMAE